MFKTYLSAYPWDLLDEGVDAVLDRLHGEIGVSGLTLWASSGPIAQLRARAAGPRLVFREGGLLFRADRCRYEATRLKPIAANWLAQRDPFGVIVDGCHQRNLTIRAAISTTRPGPALGRHVEMACRNVWAIASTRSLCLIHPDVQAYLCALITDLTTHHELEAVVLAHFVAAHTDHERSDLTLPRSLSDPERSLLATCFCESCRQGASEAGVDVDKVAGAVRSLLDKSLSSHRPVLWDLTSFLADHPTITAFYRWRATACSELLDRLCQACRCELLVLRDCDADVLCARHDPDYSIAAGVIRCVGATLDLAGDPCPATRRSELSLTARQVVELDASQLVTMFAQAAEAGLAAVTIEDFGLLPDDTCDVIRQAVRFARRTGMD